MKRPKSPKTHKGKTRERNVNVRLTSSELETMVEVAEADKRTLSDWIRKTLNAAVETLRGEQQL